MKEKEWEILINSSKEWVSLDQKTRIKFSSFPGPADECKLKYSINDGDEKSVNVHISFLDNGPWQIKSYNIILSSIIIFHQDSIDVKLPEVEGIFFQDKATDSK